MPKSHRVTLLTLCLLTALAARAESTNPTDEVPASFARMLTHTPTALPFEEPVAIRDPLVARLVDALARPLHARIAEVAVEDGLSRSFAQMLGQTPVPTETAPFVSNRDADPLLQSLDLALQRAATR
jgi:hypothetical protein